MKMRIWLATQGVWLVPLIFLLGCSRGETPPGPTTDFVNPYQATADIHNALCGAILDHVIQDAANVRSIHDLDRVLECGYNEAISVNRLSADYRKAVSKGAEVMTLYVKPDLTGGTLARRDRLPGEIEEKLRALYTAEEVEVFRLVLEKMGERLPAETYSAEVKKAERWLEEHPTRSSDALMRTLAVARASYRFWQEQGPQYCRRLRKETNPHFALARIDSSDEFNASGAAVIDLETMAICAAGGATAVFAIEACGSASAIQFIYDNRQTLGDALSSEYVWQMWFNGFLFW